MFMASNSFSGFKTPIGFDGPLKIGNVLVSSFFELTEIWDFLDARIVIF